MSRARGAPHAALRLDGLDGPPSHPRIPPAGGPHLDPFDPSGRQSNNVRAGGAGAHKANAPGPARPGPPRRRAAAGLCRRAAAPSGPRAR